MLRQEVLALYNPNYLEENAKVLLWHFFFASIFMITTLRFILGLAFLIFGMAKLFPIETFENLLVNQGLSSWANAPFFARIIVFGEVFLGTLLLLNFKTKTTLKVTLGVITLLTIYLVVDLVLHGNQNDCGCTGQLIELNSYWSIIKNIFLGSVTLYLLKVNIEKDYKKTIHIFTGLIIGIVGIILILAPFYLKPEPSERLDQPIDLSVIPNEELSGKPIDFKNENLLVFFVSPKCPHCHLAIQKLKVIQNTNEILPTYLVFYGYEENVRNYVKENDLDFPYVIFPDQEFMRIVSGSFPSIFHVNKGILEHQWTGDQFNPEELIAL